MAPRRIDVFFYGLFMDQDLLRAKGVDPTDIRPASVSGYTLRIGRSATLAPEKGGRVHGLLMSLSVPEVDRLYADPFVKDYRPEGVFAELGDGQTVPALCYNLIETPAPEDHVPEYAHKLRALAAGLCLPPEYVASIR